MKVIKDLDPYLIISIVIGKLIPFTLKYKNLDEQPITKLIISVGKAMLKEVSVELYKRDLKNLLLIKNLT